MILILFFIAAEPNMVLIWSIVLPAEVKFYIVLLSCNYSITPQNPRTGAQNLVCTWQRQ